MTLAELVVAAAVTTAVAGVTLAALVPAEQRLSTQIEASDLQQRLRVAADALAGDLRSAGLVLPYRAGDRGDDVAMGVFHRQGTMTALLDGPDAPARGIPRGPSRTYYLATDDEGVPQLMRYDGRDTTMPVVESVVVLSFELFGEGDPPTVRTLTADAGDRRFMTYGPLPPPSGVDDETDAWGAGENCVMRIVDDRHVPRLDRLGAGDPVALRPAQLVDGPWCPDEHHAGRFDADLLRVRRVQVTLRIQATATFRGPDRVWFLDPGRAADHRAVRDEEIRFSVSPRNLNGDR